MTRAARARTWSVAVLLGGIGLGACSTGYGAADAPDASDAPDGSAGCVLACGPHGTCSGGGSAATCVCAAGYAGNGCGECAPGFASNPTTGACESGCAAVKCGAHSTCQLQKGAPVCSCVLGYTLKADTCTWSGGPLDPTFEMKPAAAWTLEGGVTIDPTATGGVSPGEAIFPRGPCATARVSQTFGMPSYADAEPLALDVSSFCSDGVRCFERYQVALNGRFHPITRVTSLAPFVTERFCLGERSFQGPLRLAFTPACQGFQEMSGLDNAAIVPAPECPGPGKIPNGNFDAVGGWTAAGTGAEIAVNSGTAGSRAGHLVVSKLCDAASLTGRISVPASSMKSAAISMSVKGTNQQAMDIAMGRDFARVSGKGVFDNVRICLPEWARGLSLPLSFSLRGGSGTCGTAATLSDFVFDDLAIVSDPSCSDPDLVSDGDFEQKGSAYRWIPFLQDGATLSFPSNPAGAHGGSGYASLTGGPACAYSGITQLISVPDAVAGAGGPQVRFWYQARVGADTAAFSSIGDALPVTQGWTQHTKCLDPKTAGHASSFSVTFASAGAGCAYPSLLLDDVDVVHSTSCPE